jgi:hypothetical protein
MRTTLGNCVLRNDRFPGRSRGGNKEGLTQLEVMQRAQLEQEH